MVHYLLAAEVRGMAGCSTRRSSCLGGARREAHDVRRRFSRSRFFCSSWRAMVAAAVSARSLALDRSQLASACRGGAGIVRRRRVGLAGDPMHDPFNRVLRALPALLWRIPRLVARSSSVGRGSLHRARRWFLLPVSLRGRGLLPVRRRRSDAPPRPLPARHAY